MTGRKYLPDIDIEKFKASLSKYQELYEDMVKARTVAIKSAPMTDERRYRLSIWQKGVPKKPESVEKQRQARLARHEHRTEEQKELLRKSSTGRKFINKDGQMKNVRPEELEFYLNDGWELGTLRKNFHYSEEHNKKIKTALTGKARTKEHCEHLSISKKGKIAINNGVDIKYIKPEELDSYVQ